MAARPTIGVLHIREPCVEPAWRRTQTLQGMPKQNSKMLISMHELIYRGYSYTWNVIYPEEALSGPGVIDWTSPEGHPARRPSAKNATRQRKAKHLVNIIDENSTCGWPTRLRPKCLRGPPKPRKNYSNGQWECHSEESWTARHLGEYWVTLQNLAAELKNRAAAGNSIFLNWMDKTEKPACLIQSQGRVMMWKYIWSGEDQ